MKFSESFSNLLKQHGFTHCFFVAGGNSMHMLDSARQHFSCVPFVHEVSATIASEYFNVVSADSPQRSFVLVTAGPGLTNTVTGVAGAYLESRELVIIGGQVKSTDLSKGQVRQRGIQEIDGVAILKPITKASIRIERPVDLNEISQVLNLSQEGRPGPVFIELCLDAQNADVSEVNFFKPSPIQESPKVQLETISRELGSRIERSTRPVLLVGGGVRFGSRALLNQLLTSLEIPVMTTWNGSDRVSSQHPLYFGRPNTWGMRYSNLLIQQADLVIAVGTRLGLQQTGFNWDQFASNAHVIQVDIDPSELEKGHPRIDSKISADATDFLHALSTLPPRSWPEWLSYCRKVRDLLPLSDPQNTHGDGYVDPFDFGSSLSTVCGEDDLVIPCSSGGAFTTMMQSFLQRGNQRIVTNKGLASMGYGLAGAIGASLAFPNLRTVLVEGDGGFCQNLQELATVDVHRMNLKMFVFANEGYASIRMTQRNYFNGEYLGCDTNTGLGFPQWDLLAKTFGMDYYKMSDDVFHDQSAIDAFESVGPTLFEVPIDPMQTYFPKISSQILADGRIVSQPLHSMSPPLPQDVAGQVHLFLE